VTRTLVVTNDFPPRPGGIQAFVQALVERLPPADVLVYTSSWSGDSEYDARQPFEVRRARTSMLLPTPGVARALARVVQDEDISSVWFGAAAPLGLLAPRLREAGARRLVATTHGHEAGWAALPGARSLLRRIARHVDVMTYLGDYTCARLAHAVGPHTRLERLAPGVDAAVFRPDPDGRRAVRERVGLSGRPIIVCVSRLVARKGQDVLISALPSIREQVPDAALLVVGEGPYRRQLERLAAERGVEGDVVFTGSLPWAELPDYFAAGDVFAMPCRTRRRGLDVEGLGIVYLEASATGLPVVAGDSGGAPDAVLEGVTGTVVDGRSVEAVRDSVVGYLTDPDRARAAGAAGREWVQREWTWEGSAARLTELLRP
jgi:phosphatidylinositol alpha-1,6-mannosyltransferase